MKVLDKDEKNIYDEIIKSLKFTKVECWDVDIPKGWIDNVESAKKNMKKNNF